MDLISIIIPLFNRADLIGETLESIQNQTYEEWECIVVDDHSTDESVQVVLSYADHDYRIKVLVRPDDREKGPSACRNFGLEQSNGIYVNWFDSDDLMSPEKLQRDLENINSGEFDFTISQTSLFDNDSKQLLRYWNDNLYSENPLNDFIIKKIGWSTNAPLWRRASLEKVGLDFNESVFNGDDFLYHIQAIEKGLRPKTINQVFVKNRVHSARISNEGIKAPSKSIIIMYLLENAEKMKLESDTILALKESSIIQLKRLYRNKFWKKAIKLSIDMVSLKSEKRDLREIVRLFLLGSVFKITSRGYRIFQ